MTLEDIKHVCAWCGVLLRGNPEAPVTSHGICEECAMKFEKEAGL